MTRRPDAVRRRALLALPAFVGLTAATQRARAQVWPSRPVLLVVGSGAGGINDIIARTLADQMTGTLRQRVVVENRPGAGTTLAVQSVIRADPDGHTLLVNGSSHAVIAPLYPTAGIDVLKDLDSVTKLAIVPLVMAIHRSVPATDYASLVDWLKANPGRMTFGTNGVGSGAYLAAALFQRMAGVELEHVPYRTTPQALTDLNAGRIGMMVDTHTLLGPHIAEGTLRGIAATTIRRSSILPDLPTFDELGLRGYDASSWTGLYAPRGTPGTVVQRVTEAVRAAIADPAVAQRFQQQGIIPPTELGPAYLSSYLARDVAKWAPILINPR